MGTIGQIHWHEGLFLRPHHLQSMQRSLLEASTEERRLTIPYPYGLVESKLSSDALENLQVQFDVLRAIMPSGVVVDAPASADLPPLAIKDRFESSSKSITVLLGVPVWYPTRGNSIDPGTDDFRAKRLYRVSSVERNDENTGENKQEVMTRRVNARLMFDDEDRTDLETIPLMRIEHASGATSSIPRLDPGLIPPCAVVGGSRELTQRLRDLANAIEAARRETVVQLTRAGFASEAMRGPQFQQMLKLRTLNRFAASLPSLLSVPSVTPFEVYLSLRELLGELAAIDPARDPFESEPYDHDSLSRCFGALIERVRGELKPSKGDRFRRVKLVHGDEFHHGELSEADLAEGNEMFLAVKTRTDPRELATLVEDDDKFKLMAKSMWQNRIRGVRLSEERHPPVELPAENGLHYFRLHRDESKRMWERICAEREIAAVWPNIQGSDFEVSLYMTIVE
ncbi:MAG: type VI secretion system baseplate subunit TssK [Phycisphaerales bacterium JB040]